MEDGLLKNKYKVFIPTLRIQSVGVVYADRDVSEEEIVSYGVCDAQILEALRLKKRVNGELVDTSFMKITFLSENTPKEMKFNYVLMRIEPYMLPVKQCFRCFAYSHVANESNPERRCQASRICRNCGEAFHSGECEKTLKCVHCEGEHPSNDRKCPEYTRQLQIKTRMSLHKEDYVTAAQFHPITYKKTKYYSRKAVPSYAEVIAHQKDHENPTRPNTQTYKTVLKQTQPNQEFTQRNKFEILEAQNDSETEGQDTFEKPIFRNPNSRNKVNRPTPSAYDHDYFKKTSHNNGSNKPKHYTDSNKKMKSLKPRPFPITLNDRAWLIKKMKAKIEELRCNIPEQATKEQIDQVFEDYMNDPTFNEEISTDTGEDPDRENHNNTMEFNDPVLRR